jgi:hypothetical protein
VIRDHIRRLCGNISHAELMQNELDQAHRSLLEAHSAREYAEAMVTYHQARIERLRNTLAREAA